MLRKGALFFFLVFLALHCLCEKGCLERSDCKECVKSDECVWCGESRRCLPGGLWGADDHALTFGGCEAFYWGTCSAESRTLYWVPIAAVVVLLCLCCVAVCLFLCIFLVCMKFRASQLDDDHDSGYPLMAKSDRRHQGRTEEWRNKLYKKWKPDEAEPNLWD